MTDAEAKVLVARLFSYLDIVEESENGNPFHPNIIRSCRATDAVAIGNLLFALKEWASSTS